MMSELGDASPLRCPDYAMRSLAPEAAWESTILRRARSSRTPASAGRWAAGNLAAGAAPSIVRPPTPPPVRSSNSAWLSPARLDRQQIEHRAGDRLPGQEHPRIDDLRPAAHGVVGPGRVLEAPVRRAQHRATGEDAHRRRVPGVVGVVVGGEVLLPLRQQLRVAASYSCGEISSSKPRGRDRPSAPARACAGSRGRTPWLPRRRWARRPAPYCGR